MTEPKAELAKLLASIFADGIVEVAEHKSLKAYREHSVLSEADVQQVFTRFLEAKFAEAMADGKITTQERLLIANIVRELKLPDTAVPTSSCDSSGTQTVGPQAARIASAAWRDAASTPGMAYSAVMPAPISAGRFGIVRISGTPGPNQRAMSCNRIPAATEMTRAPEAATGPAIERATCAICCGFTASTTVRAPTTAAGASASVVTA